MHLLMTLHRRIWEIRPFTLKNVSDQSYSNVSADILFYNAVMRSWTIIRV